jgi:hypothetical protein
VIVLPQWRQSIKAITAEAFMTLVLSRALVPYVCIREAVHDARAQSGQGLVEYAILVALVSIAAVGVIVSMQASIINLFHIPLNVL